LLLSRRVCHRLLAVAPSGTQHAWVPYQDSGKQRRLLLLLM